MQKSGKLFSDEAFVAAQARQSQFAYNYHTAFAPNKLETNPFAASCTTYTGGCKQFNVTGATVDTYSKKIIPGVAGWTRTQPSASTQLIGGPFKARGDGALMNPDSVTEAWTPSGGSRHHCNKHLSEVTYDTWACINAPLAVEEGVRGGVSTRQGLQYISGC
jgi:hypothetical protein